MEKGHQFRTQSDTEVVLHLFEDVGVDVASHLDGMFAFCIVNLRDRSLYLARDRYGEKPLFYWNRGESLAFSSELQSLLLCPKVPRKVNLNLLECYLRHRIVAGPETMFRDVSQLAPGHWMTWREGELQHKNYYSRRIH
ncbi:MAG: hypothetical protein FJ267_11825 [Planctomycetes bacterium]|nr:hypothetical protein [Planctomycetota bacterium]